MKKINGALVIVVSISIIASLLLQGIAFAQLVVTEGKYKVSKVDKGKSRLEVTNTDGTSGISYVLVDGSTKVYNNGRQVSWTSIKVGTIITVKGGTTWDLKIKAKEIKF
ncbi:MAG: hypothetical protein M1536_05325 [Firmicutes bacterium]|nr:hypothetical protein [Bacillota bacterium]